MAGLPPSLAIALWFAGSIWLVAIIVYATDAPAEIVVVIFIIGLGTAYAEWRAIRRKSR